MAFAEKLKAARKRTGLSQERLAERLGVSRQAVTKWETGAGVPDVDNLVRIASLFGASIDELLSDEPESPQPRQPVGYPFESVMEYDIAEPKRYDLKLGGARRLVLTGCDGEKLRVRLASHTLPTLQSDFKVRIDDTRKRIDVDVNRRNDTSEALAKERVDIFVQIPTAYVGKIECAANAGEVEVCSLSCDSLELDVKTPRIALRDVDGTVEVNCNLDMELTCRPLSGYLALNQVSATSRLHVPADAEFAAVAKGMGTRIFYERDGKRAEPFDTPDADSVIELNGIKSELVICTDTRDA